MKKIVEYPLCILWGHTGTEQLGSAVDSKELIKSSLCWRVEPAAGVLFFLCFRFIKPSPKKEMKRITKLFMRYTYYFIKTNVCTERYKVNVWVLTWFSVFHGSEVSHWTVHSITVVTERYNTEVKVMGTLKTLSG